MNHNLLGFFGLLTAAVLCLTLARRWRWPSMLGYLVVGMLLGPHGIGLIEDNNEMELFAEFGIVFLMFSIGLEFNLTKLRAMRTLVFGFGLAQMAITGIGTMLVTLYGYGQDWRSGIAVGLAAAMSSTAIVAKMLSERFELHSRSGHQTMGVLLFQDLAVVPCLILFPALAQPGGELAASLAKAMLQATGVLIILIWLGQRLMERLYDRIAATGSEEIFVLSTLWIVVGLSFATAESGLSLALGAFVGGMLISETHYRHQVEADIRPFRDLLLGLFFVSIGMLLDLQFVIENLHRLILAVALLIAAKGGVVLLIAMAMRTPLDISLRTAAQLAQAGEFGLVLIDLAMQHQLIGADVFQVTLTAMLVSMFIAPLLINQAARLGSHLKQGSWSHNAKAIHDIATSSFCLDQHVILCGFGRTGRLIGSLLDEEGHAFLALDIDPQPRRDRNSGQLVFGNAERPEVLQAAGVSRAAAVVVTYPDAHSALRVIHQVRKLRRDIPILVRTQDDTAVARLKQAGATEVIPEVIEGSLTLATETLIRLGSPAPAILERIRMIRSERYPSLRE